MKTRLAVIGVAVAFACAGGVYAKEKKSKPTSEDKKENKEELGKKGDTVAKADIDAKSGSKLKGKATFTKNDKGEIVLRIEVSDAPAGEHAVHIHEKGDCSSPDGKSAGDHWNPTHMEHGKWGAPGDHHHLGDIGNLTVGARRQGHHHARDDEVDRGHRRVPMTSSATPSSCTAASTTSRRNPRATPVRASAAASSPSSSMLSSATLAYL